MSSYERAARKILEKMHFTKAEAEPWVQVIIDCLLEEEPGRNDVVQRAYLVAVQHKLLYPTDVFPANGLTPDAWAAKGCRLVAESIGNAILRLQDKR